MALDGLGSVGGVSGAADLATLGDEGAAAFRARAGRAKRLARLAREMRQVDSVRGKLSLLYARLSTRRRVRAMQQWSAAEHGARIGHADMRQLFDRVTRGCAQAAQACVFHGVAQTYCRQADTEQLLSLRRMLAAPSMGAGCPDGTPGKDPARQASETLAAMLDAELARRTILPPLRQLVQALGPSTDALDAACGRLAVRLNCVGDEGIARRLLAAALAQLRHAELGALATQLAPSGGRDDGAATCGMALALANRRGSPDLWRQRLALIEGLQDAVADAARERLEYYVHATRRLMEFQLGQGRGAQAVYDLAWESLSKSLDVLRYRGVLDPLGGDLLAPRLIAAALMRTPVANVLAFVGQLNVKTLNTLVHAMETGGADMAGAAALVRSVRDDRVQGYRDQVIAGLRELNRALAGGGRWAALQALKDLATACAAWESGGAPGGHALSPLVEQDLHVAVQHALALAARASTAPAVFDETSIAGMGNDEILCLRQCEAGLRKYGLAIDQKALNAVARERGLPYRAMAMAAVDAVLDALAAQEADPSRILHGLRDCVDPVAAIYANQASLLAMTPDDALRLCAETSTAAWQAYVDRHPDRIASVRAALARIGHTLSNGLNDAASCLADDDQAGAFQPAAHVAWRLRLASHLMEALFAASLPDGAEPTRDAAGLAFTARWTPALCKTVEHQFGVRYDPVKAQARLVMPAAQHEDFAKALLDTEIIAKNPVYRDVAVAGGPRTIQVDEQFVRDAIDRNSTQFSVTGVNRLGEYIPYTPSAQRPGEHGPRFGAERALAALCRLAGADTLRLSPYLTQTLGAQFLKALYAQGAQSPIRLEDGSPVLPGGAGVVRTDLSGLADGSYVLRTTIIWEALGSVTGFTGVGTKLDPEQSFASLGCDILLAPTPTGGWRQEMTGPLDVRYRLVPAQAPT